MVRVPSMSKQTRSYFLMNLNSRRRFKGNRRFLVMAVTVNVYYKGTGGSARAFAEEAKASGILDAIRSEQGCERYCYHISMDDPDTVLLAERWADRDSFEAHKAGQAIRMISELKDRFGVSSVIEVFDGGSS